MMTLTGIDTRHVDLLTYVLDKVAGVEWYFVRGDSPECRSSLTPADMEFHFKDDHVLGFRFLRNGAYRIFDDGMDCGTWPPEYLHRFFDTLYFGEFL
jgi:hypothetical protein